MLSKNFKYLPLYDYLFLNYKQKQNYSVVYIFFTDYYKNISDIFTLTPTST